MRPPKLVRWQDQERHGGRIEWLVLREAGGHGQAVPPAAAVPENGKLDREQRRHLGAGAHRVPTSYFV